MHPNPDYPDPKVQPATASLKALIKKFEDLRIRKALTPEAATQLVCKPGSAQVPLLIAQGKPVDDYTVQAAYLYLMQQTSSMPDYPDPEVQPVPEPAKAKSEPKQPAPRLQPLQPVVSSREKLIHVAMSLLTNTRLTDAEVGKLVADMKSSALEMLLCGVEA